MVAVHCGVPFRNRSMNAASLVDAWEEGRRAECSPRPVGRPGRGEAPHVTRSADPSYPPESRPRALSSAPEACSRGFPPASARRRPMKGSPGWPSTHKNFTRPSAYCASMSISQPPRGRRSSVWTGAVLLVLLAALMHVLGCAHGPVPTSAPRVDAVPVVSAGCAHDSGQPQGSVGVQAPAAPDGTGHCVGPDEPTVQPPRDIERPSQADVMNQAARTTVPARPAPRCVRVSTSHRGTLSTAQTRASLGVWRS